MIASARLGPIPCKVARVSASALLMLTTLGASGASSAMAVGAKAQNRNKDRARVRILFIMNSISNDRDDCYGWRDFPLRWCTIRNLSPIGKLENSPFSVRRSEERRVGKECVERCERCHIKTSE